MNIPISIILVLFCASDTISQLPEHWWEQFSTTTPTPRTSPKDNLLDYYYDNNYENNLDGGPCCECVPFYQCGENNTIIDDGGDIIGPRFGETRVTDVEVCPDVTQLCCRVPTASPTCELFANRVESNPDTPCDCINWDFCLEEFRISDGTPSTTFVEGKALPGHAKCQHSLEVCCVFKPEPSVPNSPPITNTCVCVNPSTCGPDGIILTDGAGLLDLRTSLTNADGTCLPSQVCCREPDDFISEITTPKPTVVTPTVLTIKDQRCNGIRNSNGISVRIQGFNDGESQFGEFPWVGMILRTYFVAGQPMNAFIGGAILIHPRVILTAAHKVANEVVASLSVRVGEWDIETDYEPGDHQVRLVLSVVVHPRYNNRTLSHDVALLILTEPVVMQSHIRSICLADSLDQVDTTACVINGWGKDNYDSGNYQTVMKSVTLPLVQHRRCQAQLRRTRLGRWFRLHPSFVCAGGELGKDACSSDGGGPLACPVRGSSRREYLLVGVTAWGIGCGQDGIPGVYASVLADKRWISSEMDQRFPGHTSVRREVNQLDEETVNAAPPAHENDRPSVAPSAGAAAPVASVAASVVTGEASGGASVAPSGAASVAPSGAASVAVAGAAAPPLEITTVPPMDFNSLSNPPRHSHNRENSNRKRERNKKRRRNQPRTDEEEEKRRRRERRRKQRHQ